MGDSSVIDTTLFTTDQSTTFSHTLDSTQNQTISKTLDLTRDELERRQLTHTIQLLKLEVSQKQLLLETVRGETGGQLEELREQLADTQHEKKLFSLKLQSMTHAYEQEVKTLRERNKLLNNKLETQVQAEESTAKDVFTIPDHAREEIELVLGVPNLSEYEYQQLVSCTTLSIPDLIKVRMYESAELLQRKCKDLGKQLADLGQEFQIQQRELQLSQQRELELKSEADILKENSSVLKLELAEVKVQIQEGNYKINNFDSIKKERDTLRREMDGVKLRLQDLEAREGLAKEELSKLNTELSHSQQTKHLHQKDKEYLDRQVSVLTLRANEAEERAGSLAMELEQAKRDRESVYDQLMNSRDEQRLDYESRMQHELETLSARTALEIKQIRCRSTEMMEREHRSLTEARDIALNERETAQTRERETTIKYQQLLKEHHELQATSEGRVSELQAKLQVAQFERERVAMVTEETTKQLSTVQLEREKLQKKVDLLSQELWRCQSMSESVKRGLETRVEEQRLRLDGYERVERDLDDLVLQAAQTEGESDAEKVLFSYGFGTCLPTTSKRRLQQSVQLARRVLQLEKMNTSLRIEQDEKQEALTTLQEQVKCLESLLERSKQPYCYLIETIRDKDRQLSALQEELVTVRKEVDRLSVERQRLVSVKNQMALDLEKLLSYNEELQQMNKLLFNGPKPPTLTCRAPSHPTTIDKDSDSGCNNPMPTLFTKPKKKSKFNHNS